MGENIYCVLGSRRSVFWRKNEDKRVAEAVGDLCILDVHHDSSVLCGWDAMLELLIFLLCYIVGYGILAHECSREGKENDEG